PNDPFVHLVLISVQVVFSGWHVLAKVALNDGVSPMALALWREVLATGLMFLVARRLDGHVVMQREHARRFALMGIASFGNVVGAVVALRHLSPMAFGLMQPSIPVLALLLSYLLGIEGMSRLKVAAVVTAVAGAILVEVVSASDANAAAADAAAAAADAAAAAAAAAGGSATVAADGAAAGGDDSGRSAAFGGIVVFLQCCSMATLAVVQKPVLAVYPPATVTLWYYAIGSAVTVAACIAFGVPVHDFALTGRLLPWLALAYAALPATLFTYNALSWATGQVAPTTVTVYSTLQPAGTLLLSALFLGYRVSTMQLFGGAVVS
ncbi:unnamed protein product, partial [Phaeothamnion confervicola]